MENVNIFVAKFTSGILAGEWLDTTGYSRTNGVQMIVHFSGLVVNRQKERRLKNACVRHSISVEDWQEW